MHRVAKAAPLRVGNYQPFRFQPREMLSNGNWRNPELACESLGSRRAVHFDRFQYLTSRYSVCFRHFSTPASRDAWRKGSDKRLKEQFGRLILA